MVKDVEKASLRGYTDADTVRLYYVYLEDYLSDDKMQEHFARLDTILRGCQKSNCGVLKIKSDC